MKKVLSFLAAFVLLGAFASSAWAFSVVVPSGQTLEFTIQNGGAVVVRPGGSSYNNYVTGDLIIPSSITYNGNTYPVTGLTFYYPYGSATARKYGTFEGCTGLTSVTIPNSVTSIGEYAFYNCSGLTSVNFTGTIAQWCNITFHNITSNPTYYTHSLNINGSPVTDIVIPNSVTSIGSSAFYNCSGLTSVTIPNSVTSIGSSAFYNCSGLTSVTIPNSVTSIGGSAFYGCSYLDTVYMMPSTRPSLGTSAFANNASGRVFILNGCSYSNYYTTSSSDSWYTYRNYLRHPIIDINVTVQPSDLTRGTAAVVLGPSNRIVRCDSTMVVHATANTGYHFDHWSNGSTANPDTITLVGDSTVTAYFEMNQYSIIGSTEQSLSYSYDFEEYDYDFDFYDTDENWENYWWVDYIDSANRALFINNDNYDEEWGHLLNEYTNNITSTSYAYKTVYLLEGDLSYSYDWRCYGESSFDYLRVALLPENMDVNESGWGTYSLPTGAIAMDGGHKLNLQSNWTTQQGTISIPNSGYYKLVFRWKNDGSDGTNPAAAVDNIVMVSTLTSDRGVVVGSDTVDYLDTVTLTAIPNEHYHFTQWNDGDTTNPRQVVATDDTTLIAYFAIDQHQLTLNVDTSTSPRGTVSGSGTYDYLSERVIRATANTGYHFDHWSNGSTANPDTITLVGDSTVTAYFIGLTVTSSDSTRGSATHTRIGNHQERITATASYGYHFDHWSNGSTANPDTITLVGDSIITAYFLPNQYTITGTSANTARGTITGSATVDYLDTVTLIAHPNYGYHLDHWTYTNENNNNTITQTGGDTLTLVANKDRSATAYFNPNQYQLTVNVDNSTHGSVSGGGTYNYNTSHTITATASYGYHFDHWSTGSTANPASITLTGDSTITAYFERNTYNLTVNVNNTSLGTWTTPLGSSALYQDTLTVVATPIAHHHVVSWQGQGIIATSADKDTVWVKMLSNRTLTCNFAIDTHTVAVTSNDIARGSVSATGTEFAYGSPCTVSATAYTGYTFQSWSNGVTANPYTFAVMEDVELTAIFVVPGEETYTVTVSVNDPTMGSATVNGNTTATVTGGTEVTLSATANSGYHFDHWSTGATDNPLSLTVTSDVSITAYFEADPTPQYTITVTSNNTAWGTVTGGGTFDEGTNITLTATANEGYHFVQWQDGNTSATRTITVTGNATYIATFAENDPDVTYYTITATANDPAMGSVSGGGTYAEGTEVTLSATANSGYRFVRWDDNNTDNPRTVTVTGDMSFTAIFEADGGTEGIEDIDASNIKVYAADGRIVVEGTDMEVSIYDMMGRQIFNSEIRNSKFETQSSQLPTGVYMVKVGTLPAKKVMVVK